MTVALARFERRFALFGALATLGELVGVGAPLYFFFVVHGLSDTQRLLFLRASPVVLGGAWLIWYLALRFWRAPLDRALVRHRAGQSLDDAALQSVARVALLLPRRAAFLRAAMMLVAALGLAVLLERHAGFNAEHILPVAVITLQHGLIVQVLRVITWSRLLFFARDAVLPDADPLRFYRQIYRRRILRAGVATGALTVFAIALFVLVFVSVDLHGFIRLETWALPCVGPLAALWWLRVRSLCTPVETYLAAATSEDPREQPTRDDPRGLDAYRAAQRLPYTLGRDKLALAAAGEILLALLATYQFGIPGKVIGPVCVTSLLMTVGAAIYEILWHRATLRPLLAHLATRHRPSPDDVPAPFGLRARMLFFLGVLTVFAGALAVFSSYVQNLRLEMLTNPPIAEAHLEVPIFMFVFVFAASMGIVVLFTADLTGPIRRLEERAAAMARGDLNRPIMHVAGEVDEVGRLTVAFEELRRALNEKLRSSTEINLSLEAEVTRRTAELERRNKELADALDALRRAQAELVRSEKMASMGRLVAGIAHEINNPVNAIVNTVKPLEDAIEEVIGDGGGDPTRAEVAADAREMIRVIRSGARRTKEIVQALHNYSRGDEETLQQVDLHRGLDESLELLRHHLKRGIKVERDYRADGRVLGNAGQLQQVFMNLLANAAQAIGDRPTGGTIHIATAREGTSVIIRVSDDGAGMSEAILPRIFDPFFTTKDVGEGSGLGLSIVHGIVERHGGNIAVDSEVGRGTTFTVTLPVERKGALPATAVAAQA